MHEFPIRVLFIIPEIMGLLEQRNDVACFIALIAVAGSSLAFTLLFGKYLPFLVAARSRPRSMSNR